MSTYHRSRVTIHRAGPIGRRDDGAAKDAAGKVNTCSARRARTKKGRARETRDVDSSLSIQPAGLKRDGGAVEARPSRPAALQTISRPSRTWARSVFCPTVFENPHLRQLASSVGACSDDSKCPTRNCGVASRAPLDAGLDAADDSRPNRSTPSLLFNLPRFSLHPWDTAVRPGMNATGGRGERVVCGVRRKRSTGNPHFG